jgi:Transposase, Mutator family
MGVAKLNSMRIERAKRAFSTRRIAPGAMRTLLTGRLRPMAGDLVLARIDMLGKQTKLELTDGRRAHLFPGDEIVVCFGNRYAPDQYEAIIGADMSPCDLVAAGGIAGIELTRHQRMIAPTKITPIGLIGDSLGRRLNLMTFGVDAAEDVPGLPAILSLGTSMNAGKTLTATSLVRGLKRAGFSVAALKITGTGSGGDMWIVRDAGADVSLDFSDAGFATTYLESISNIERGTYRLLNHAARLGCDIAVIEIADGLQQRETAQLFRSDAVRKFALGAVFASYDAMGAKNGVDLLRDAGHEVLALSGRLGRSPLGVREAEESTGLRVYSPWELQDGALMPAIREQAAKFRASPEFQHLSLEKIAAGVSPDSKLHICSPIADALPAAGMASEADRRWNAERAVLRALPTTGENGQVLRLTTASEASQNLPREVLSRVAAFIMAKEVARLCAAPFGARLEGRANRRNGSRIAIWKTAFGPISIRVPRLRLGRYRPNFLQHVTFDSAARQVEHVFAVTAAERASDFESALKNLVFALGAEKSVAEELNELGSELRALIGRARPQAVANGLGIMNDRLASLPADDRGIVCNRSVIDGGMSDRDDFYEDFWDMDEEVSLGQAFHPSHAIAGE